MYANSLISDKLVTAIEESRKKLLDLTTKNNLINFKHNKSCIRVIDELPDELFRIMTDESKMLTFIPVYRPPLACYEVYDDDGSKIDLSKIQETKLPDFIEKNEGKEPPVEDYAKHIGLKTQYELMEQPEDGEIVEIHLDTNIQVLLYPEDLEKRMRNIYSKYKSSIEETGVNILYLALGFLEWFESNNSDRKRVSPLFLVPVNLTKAKRINKETNTFFYNIDFSDADLMPNLSLQEKLKLDFGINLPDFDDNETPEAYFKKCADVISGIKRWELKRYITLGTFSFAKLLLYKDLDTVLNKRVVESSLVRQLILNEGITSVEQACEIYDIDSIPIKENPAIVLDADSSQMSAILDAVNGTSFVLEGPPGTGKSQTISNIISSLIAENKTVLFVSEKMAALEVVKKRLDSVGLGEFCLELHSNKASKKWVLNQLDQRINYEADFSEIGEENRIVQYNVERTKGVINEILQVLSERFGKLHNKIYEYIYLRDKYKKEIDGYYELLNRFKDFECALIDDFKDNEILSLLEKYQVSLNTILGNAQKLDEVFWHGFSNSELRVTQVDDLINNFREIANYLKMLANKSNDLKEYGLMLGDAVCILNLKEYVAKLEMMPVFSEDEIIVDMLSVFQDQEKFKLAKQIKDKFYYCENLKETKVRKIEENSKEFNYTKEEVSALINFSHKLSIDDLKLSDLKEYFVNLKGMFEIHSKIKAKESVVWDILDLEIKGNNDSLELYQNISDVLDTIENRTVEIRNNKMNSREGLQIFELFKRDIQEYDILISKLPTFDLSNFLDIDSIDFYIGKLKYSNYFSRLFSKEFKRLKIELARASREQIPKDFLDLMKLTQNISNVLKKKLEIESNYQYREIFGLNFHGVETNLNDFEKLVNFYSTANKIFDKDNEKNNKIKNWLFNSHDDLLKNSIDKYKANKTVFIELCELAKDFIDRHKRHCKISNKEIPQLSPDDFENSDRLVTFVSNFNGYYGYELKVFLLTLVKDIEHYEKVNNDIEVLSQEIENSEKDLYNYTKILTHDSCDFLSDDVYFKFFKTHDIAKKIIGIDEKFLTKHYFKLLTIFSKIKTAIQNIVDEIKEVESVGKFDFRDWFDYKVEPLADLQEHVSEAIDNVSDLNSYTSFLAVKEEIGNLGLDELIRSIESGKIPVTEIVNAYKFILYNNIVKVIYLNKSVLSKYQVADYEKFIEDFIINDKRLIQNNPKVIALNETNKCIPEGVKRGPVTNRTELALIQREIEKQRRHIPIRKLIDKAGKALVALKPCLMMGPMSVAQFLQNENLIFDVVVMDEASQLKPEYAYGAIARGKQLIVVGDAKQLPPTNFFDKINADDSIDEEEEYEYHSAESILDLAARVFDKRRILKWHYRSKHENLIKFSNHHFYNGQLVVFPSAINESDELGIKYHHISDARYHGSKNELEAMRLVEALFKHIKIYPNKSVGVVAVNTSQRDLIFEKFENIQKKDHAFRELVDNFDKKMQAERNEDIFIKNLENVQGDERDVIFISMTYGKGDNNIFRQNFGPINKEQGHRRLNVLFTRARYKIELFTSFEAEDVVLSETSKEGVRVLKNYLKFARDGFLIDEEIPENKFDSPFEVSVYNRLKDKGYNVKSQIGVAGYRIDLAIVNPYRKGEYLCGIECDGATYHSTKYARDRDRIRQNVLENLGWNIHRIWSTDWFAESDKCLEKVVSKIDRLMEIEAQKYQQAEARDTNILMQDVRLEGLNKEQVAKQQGSHFYSRDEAYRLLTEYREKELKRHITEFDIKKSILSEELIGIYLEKLPVDKEEWRQVVPYEYRAKVDISQMSHLVNVFEVLENTLE